MFKQQSNLTVKKCGRHSLGQVVNINVSLTACPKEIPHGS